MPATDRAVVVGASLAGVRAAEALRREGHDGPLTVVGAEAHQPYDRPPLSKQLLIGKVDTDDVALALGDDLDIEWCLGTAAIGLDLAGSRLHLAGGDRLPFDRLVVATGSHARHLPGWEGLEGVHLLRTLDDAVALRAALQAGSPRVVIVGAGVIGLEVASSASALGLDVTVLEAAPLPLGRLVGPALGPFIVDLHRDHGVDVRLGVVVDGPVVAGGRVEGVRLAGADRVVAADVVVVGVGASPTTAWLEDSGVDLDDGVRCDGRLRVLAGGRALPHVVAAGDVTRWDRPDPVSGTAVATRVEHWTNAVEQGGAAAVTLVRGEEAPAFGPVPYMWSDQQGCKLQLVGLPEPDDEVAIVDGSLEDRKFVAAYRRAGRLVAAVGCSRPAKVMALRAQIDAGAAFPPPAP